MKTHTSPTSTDRVARTPAAIGARTAACALLLGLALPGAGSAQAPPGPTVSWTVAASPTAAVKRGGRLLLTLRGEVLEGWHVYGLKQSPDGPTPLLVTLEPSDVATPDGPPIGSPPVKRHDPSFNLETQFYSAPFTVTVPVRIGPHVPAGARVVPVSVRFQTCNGQICQPPKTAHLSAAITVAAEG